MMPVLDKYKSALEVRVTQQSELDSQRIIHGDATVINGNAHGNRIFVSYEAGLNVRELTEAWKALELDIERKILSEFLFDTIKTFNE